MRRLVVLLALAAFPGGALAANPACRIGLDSSGPFLTIQAIATGLGRPLTGHYDLLVDVRRGTNASVSSQSGKFSIPAGKRGKDVILSTSRVFVPSGASVKAILRLTTDAGAAFCRSESTI